MQCSSYSLLKLHSYQLQTFYSLLCMIFAYCKLLVTDGSVKWLSQSLIHSTNCPSRRYQFYHLIALCGHCRSTVEPLNFLLVTLPTPPLPLLYCHALTTPLPLIRSCYTPPFWSQAHTYVKSPMLACCRLLVSNTW